MMNHKAWQPGKILITSGEISASVNYATFKGWQFCPSPINAAFVVMLALTRVINEED